MRRVHAFLASTCLLMKYASAKHWFRLPLMKAYLTSSKNIGKMYEIPLPPRNVSPRLNYEEVLPTRYQDGSHVRSEIWRVAVGSVQVHRNPGCTLESESL